VISLTKELEQAKQTIELAEKTKKNAQEDATRAAEMTAIKQEEFEQQLENIRKDFDVTNDEKLALSAQLEHIRAELEDLKEQKDAMESDLVETCSLLEKVSAKATAASDEYKRTISDMTATSDAMREKLEGEVMLAMDLTAEKDFIIKELEIRQSELDAQIEALKETSSSNASKVIALENKLKEAGIAERERLLVLQEENKRLEKRLKDTWTALQGAHAVAEQTKAAAMDAVRNATAAAAKAENVAIKAKRDLEEARKSGAGPNGLQSISEIPAAPSQSATRLSSQSAIHTAPQRTLASSFKSSSRKVTLKSAAFDNEMQQASDLLERISRQSRESSVKDDGSVGKGGSETSSQAGAGALYGYRGVFHP